ncbi:hypothetical protein LJ655_13685 [Paraburkholderia sp. MMS20-SJTN17]|uniref:Uncharacterized protein n=1 Tax=Paraburkholderia translucens TaxID=2886945 RepID=A0ABS8KEP0_9BURK|nr:hypothetical protein [Paraburkholderia sp. MMS20-SJTN17]MCC8402923.1 hypothetical protein [Paraburkholderia sp. MMS20-SJTN17]
MSLLIACPAIDIGLEFDRFRDRSALCVFKHALAILALPQWSVAVAFHPAVNIVAASGVCSLMVVRKRRAGPVSRNSTR